MAKIVNLKKYYEHRFLFRRLLIFLNRISILSDNITKNEFGTMVQWHTKNFEVSICASSDTADSYDLIDLNILHNAKNEHFKSIAMTIDKEDYETFWVKTIGLGSAVEVALEIEELEKIVDNMLKELNSIQKQDIVKELIGDE